MTKLQTIAALTFFYAPKLAAQTAANWTQQSPQTSPSARVTTIAYDSTHKQVVLFGGGNDNNGANGTFLNDTWVWDGANWTQIFPQTSPPARAEHSMAFDSAHGQVVLFGGDGQNLNPLNDTWVWDGANWTQKLPLASPSTRFASAMAYDSAHGQVVLFGGVANLVAGDNTPTLFNDAWAWDGSNWTQKFPQVSPPVRLGHSMAYDSTRSRVVLFGGADENGNALGDTWVWDGSNWTQESPKASPPARGFAAMAYDSIHDQSILFGGAGATSLLLVDTWLWDGTNWTQESPLAQPPGRITPAMAYDSPRGQAVLFGGIETNQGLFGDTWTWSGGALPPDGPSISAVVSASAFGGFSSVAPGSWVEIYGSNLAPSTQGWTGADFTSNNAPTSLNGVSVSIGGQAAFVDYISATQVNAQLPSNISTGGALELTVTNANGTSAASNITVNPTEPGLLAPASFKIGANQYVVAQLSDGSYVLPTGSIAGVTSRPAQSGETIVIYGVGFGSVTPNISAGEIVTEANQLSASFEILFGQTPAQLPYFGLAPSFVGLYQFNVVVPSVADSALVPLAFSLGGVAGTQTLFTAVQR